MRTRSLLAVTALLLAGAVPALAERRVPLPPDDPAVLVIAHRGASGLAPEHTLAAYDLAVEQGADYLELDAQSTADGVLVSVHDTTLDRTARGPAADCTGTVRSKTLAQLRRCDVGVWKGEQFAGARIPTVSEVMDRYGDRTNLHVEVKDTAPGTVRELLRLLDVHGLRAAAHRDWRVLVQSFSPADLLLARALDPALPTVQLLAALPPAGPAREALLDRVATYADGIGPSATGVDAAAVQAAHSRCLQVQPYTVDDPQRLRALVDAGVDGVFTNRPDVLVEVLGERRTQRPGADLQRAARAARADRACRA